MTSIENIIKEKGPILSGEIIKELIDNDLNLSNNAARKRLSRIKGDVYRVKGLFADRQVLFHDKEIFRTPEYYQGIEKALEKSGKQYHLILQSLDFHHGFVKQDQLANYSSNPIEKLKGHLTFDTAISKLLELQLISKDDEYFCLSTELGKKSNQFQRAKGIELAKNFLLIQFNDWTRKIGLVSYDTFKFNSEFGKYQFNFVSPSYIGNLPRRSKSNLIPSFIIADILIGNPIKSSEVDFIISKVETLKAQKGLASFVPFLLVDSLDNKALNKLKSKGVVIGFIDQLFGDGYKDLLNSLINLVTNAGAILKKNPDQYLDLISKLNKLVEGKTNNLRGDLFEFAVGYYQGRICQSIDIGKTILFEGEKREIDVIGITANKVVVCECKGYKSQISKDDIEIWLGEKIPVIRKWILDIPAYTDLEIEFQYWSTGGFHPDAQTILQNRKDNTKKYSIEFYNLDDIFKKCEEFNSKKFTEILREYYKPEMT